MLGGRQEHRWRRMAYSLATCSSRYIDSQSGVGMHRGGRQREIRRKKMQVVMIYSESGRWGIGGESNLCLHLRIVLRSWRVKAVAPPPANCVHSLEQVQLKQRRGSHWLVAVVTRLTGTAQRGRRLEFRVLVLAATERVSSQEGGNETASL